MEHSNDNENNKQDNRPQTVPAEAKWNEAENEWEIGNYNEDGKKVGEWKWWLAPHGHLCCHTFYKEDGSRNFTFTRFHPDGSFSFKGQYVNNLPHGEFVSQKSLNETTEIYRPADGFKAITTFVKGYVIEERYFDENDNEIGNIKESSLTKQQVIIRKAVQYLNTHVLDADNTIQQAVIEFAKTNWAKALELLHTNNDNKEANILASYCSLYCAIQLEEDNAEELAHALLNYIDFELWSRYPQQIFPIYAKRFAYHFLASLAKLNANYTDALNYIKEAICIDESTGNDLDNIPLLELKAEIYVATNKLDLAFFPIQQILNLDPTNTAFIEITKSEAYLNHIETYNLEKLKKGEEPETAMQALVRYETFLTLRFNGIKDEDVCGSSFEKENFCFTAPEDTYYTSTTVTEGEIKNAETRLQCNFPPSYRKFILEHGLFRLGKDNYNESRLLPPQELTTLDEWLEGEGHYFDEEDRQDLKNLILFSYGEEDLIELLCYCFDKRSLNLETGEMSVSIVYSDDYGEYALPICKTQGFDTYVRTLVDDKIEEMLE